MERTVELEKRKNYLSSKSLEDYLSEDPPINNQNFFILSYLLPGENNELKFPTIKVRGSYKTQEECQRRIEKIKVVDPYFNMYICEVGKFGALIPEDEISKMDDIDIHYRETLLNEMVRDYQENKDKSDIEFERRKNFLKERAVYEGSKEGQELLAKKKESPLAVKTRIETMTQHLDELVKRIDEVREIIKLSEEQYASYTEEELREVLEATVVTEKDLPDVKGKQKID